jgi:hypothetical protein
MAITLFDTFTRGLSRQQPTSASVTSEDRKRNKKRNKNNGGQKKIFALCNREVTACESFVQDECGGNAACVAAATPCCERLGSCDFTGFITCINDATAP